MSDDLTRLPASTLREKIAAKEVSPVELMKAVLERALGGCERKDLVRIGIVAERRRI